MAMTRKERADGHGERKQIPTTKRERERDSRWP